MSDPGSVAGRDEGDEAPGGRGAAERVLGYLARSIVDDAEAISIERDSTRHGVVFRLHVAPDDMGKIIGRHGRVAQAIRTVVRAAGAREGIEATVDIVD